MKLPLVIIQIVNFNGSSLLGDVFFECMQSIFLQTFKNFIVHVIDNNSTDSSVEDLHKRFPAVKITRANRNVGYSANNLGLKYYNYTEAEYLVVMNNDVILEKNCIGNLVEFMESHKSAGGANPLILMNRKRDIVWSGGLIVNKAGFASNDGFLKQMDAYVRGCNRLLSGACMILRKNAVEATRLFDYAYGSYYEDADISLRIVSETEFSLELAENAFCYHEVSASFKRNSEKADYLMLRNQYLLILKRFPFFDMMNGLFHLFAQRFMKRIFLHGRIFIYLFIHSPSIVFERIRSLIARKKSISMFLSEGFEPYPKERFFPERTEILSQISDEKKNFPACFIAGVNDERIGAGFSMLSTEFPVSRRIDRRGLLYLNIKKGKWIASGYPDNVIVSVFIDGQKTAGGFFPLEFEIKNDKLAAETVIEAESPINLTFIGSANE
ncbi:MAG: glycosyltransferase [bacterium]|nr:glycosyltransferase [bacterium]